MSIFDDICKTYTADIPLLAELGLATWKGCTGETIHVGDVRPFEEDETEDRTTVISIYVLPLPAQCYRFEIIRQSDIFDGMESVTVRTGSGDLTTFWPIALAAAGNMFSVSPATPASSRTER